MFGATGDITWFSGPRTRMTGRLTPTRAFEGAGFKTDEAERIATEIYDAIHDNVATKTDFRNEVAVLRADLRKAGSARNCGLKSSNVRSTEGRFASALLLQSSPAAVRRRAALAAALIARQNGWV
jgi:hypothetical protein